MGLFWFWRSSNRTGNVGIESNYSLLGAKYLVQGRWWLRVTQACRQKEGRTWQHRQTLVPAETTETGGPAGPGRCGWSLPCPWVWLGRCPLLSGPNRMAGSSRFSNDSCCPMCPNAAQQCHWAWLLHSSVHATAIEASWAPGLFTLPAPLPTPTPIPGVLITVFLFHATITTDTK